MIMRNSRQKFLPLVLQFPPERAFSSSFSVSFCPLHLSLCTRLRLRDEHGPFCVYKLDVLQSVGSIKLEVSFAKYCLFYKALLQKRPVILYKLDVSLPYTSWTCY